MSAMKRHSPAPSLGHSDVVSTQEAAIQFKLVNTWASPQIAARRLPNLTTAPSQYHQSRPRPCHAMTWTDASSRRGGRFRQPVQRHWRSDCESESLAEIHLPILQAL
jgi:hypothetical protein